MNHNVVQPASYSTGQPIEGVQQVLGYTSEPYPTWAPPFSVIQGGREREREHDFTTEEPGEEERDVQSLPPFFQLAVNISYRELIHYFLVPEHERIFSLQSRLRSAQKKESLTIFFPNGRAPKEFATLRNYLYSVQIQLFQTPRGLHCHLVL